MISKNFLNEHKNSTIYVVYKSPGGANVIKKVDFIETGIKKRYCFIPYEDECFYDTDCIYYHHHANQIGRCGTDSMFIFDDYNFFNNIEDVKHYFKNLGITRVWTPWEIIQNVDELTEESINYI